MRTDYRPQKSMTTILLITNIACFMVLGLFEYTRIPISDWLALSLDGLKHGLVYQLITFQFMHGGVMHLLGNMLVLFFFGRAMEEALGRYGLLRLYLLCGTMGGLLQVAYSFLPGVGSSPVVGASAGVFGLVAAFAMTHPNQPILLFFVLPVPAKYLLAFEGIWAVWGVIHPVGNTAHAAHLGGMLAGMAYIFWNLDSALTRFHLPRFFQRRERVIITPPKRMWRSTARRTTDDLPSDDFISGKVDPILEKISAKGIHSLTEEERQILEMARRKMSRK